MQVYGVVLNAVMIDTTVNVAPQAMIADAVDGAVTQGVTAGAVIGILMEDTINGTVDPAIVFVRGM